MSTTEIDGVLNFSLLGPHPAEPDDYDLLFLRVLLRRGLQRYAVADYLLTARTGLMLALRPLIASLLGQFDETRQSGPPLFTAPVQDFLRSLARQGVSAVTGTLRSRKTLRETC